jgi:hypothetical protein
VLKRVESGHSTGKLSKNVGFIVSIIYRWQYNKKKFEADSLRALQADNERLKAHLMQTELERM